MPIDWADWETTMGGAVMACAFTLVPYIFISSSLLLESLCSSFTDPTETGMGMEHPQVAGHDHPFT